MLSGIKKKAARKIVVIKYSNIYGKTKMELFDFFENLKLEIKTVMIYVISFMAAKIKKFECLINMLIKNDCPFFANV